MLFWAVLFGGTATAQMADEPLYYPYAEEEEERALPLSDYTLFYRAIRSVEDLYGSVTAFQLPQVTLKRRGNGYDRERAVLHDLPIGYRHYSMLRLLGADERVNGTSQGEPIVAIGELRRFRFTEDRPLQPVRIAARYAERNYRFGAQLTYDDQLGDAWHLSAAADYRTGRDARIEGVFTHALHLGTRLSRRWARGDEVLITLSAPLSMRGLRAASTEEAFALTDDPYYNPAWGLQAGKVRHARVRREVLPMVAAAWSRPLNEQVTMHLSLGGEAGVRRQSSLGWYDARSPQADNYRAMPSYTRDAANEAAWRRGDPRYTQVAWDELIAQNRMAAGAAHYALEDRVTRSLTGSARWGVTAEWAWMTLNGGVWMDQREERHFKELRDLLGAEYLLDVDHFLIDDDSYANRRENDLRNPSRRIGEGDRFGYDYRLSRRDVGAWLRLNHRSDRLQFDLAMKIAKSSLFRQGYYEKELFPAAQSYGRSRQIEADPYAVQGAVGWSFSPRCYAEFTCGAAGELPDAASLFIQPLYNNRTIDRPTLERHYTAQLRLHGAGERFDWQVALFATLLREGVESRSYYDDVAGAYSNLTVSGIATSSMGMEGALQWRIDSHWSLSAAASWGRYRYVENPHIKIVTDADNSPIEEAATAYMGDCRIGGVPTWTGTMGVRYYGERGWGFRLSAGVAADRYVDPAYVRRTDRVARQSGATPETIAAFTRQERLDDAFTLDLMLFKSIRFSRSQLQFTLALRNLTAGEYPSYGYESMRSQRMGSTASSLRMPQATRYLYAAPRSAMLTVGYRF